MSEQLDIATLCDWSAQHDISHQAFHHGEPCPYSVVAAVLAGQPDPRDAIAQWRLDLSAALKPNGAVPLDMNQSRRMHFAVYSKLSDQIKAVTRRAVTAACIPHLDAVHVELHYRPRTTRTRDADNTVTTLKAAIDALHQRPKPRPGKPEPEPYEPIIDDDDPAHVTWAQPQLHPPRKGQPPALWLVLRSSRVSVPVEAAEQPVLL